MWFATYKKKNLRDIVSLFTLLGPQKSSPTNRSVNPTKIVWESALTYTYEEQLVIGVTPDYRNWIRGIMVY